MLCVVGMAVWMDVVCCRCGYLGEWGMLCVRCRFRCFGEYMGGGAYKLSLWVFGISVWVNVMQVRVGLSR